MQLVYTMHAIGQLSSEHDAKASSFYMDSIISTCFCLSCHIYCPSLFATYLPSLIIVTLFPL